MAELPGKNIRRPGAAVSNRRAPVVPSRKPVAPARTQAASGRTPARVLPRTPLKKAAELPPLEFDEPDVADGEDLLQDVEETEELQLDEEIEIEIEEEIVIDEEIDVGEEPEPPPPPVAAPRRPTSARALPPMTPVATPNRPTSARVAPSSPPTPIPPPRRPASVRAEPPPPAPVAAARRPGSVRAEAPAPAPVPVPRRPGSVRAEPQPESPPTPAPVSAPRRTGSARAEPSRIIEPTNRQGSTSSRRTSKPAEAPKPIPMSYKIIAGGVVLAILVLVFGYGPFMRSRYTAAIDTAPSAAERKDAAASLYGRHDGGAFPVFQERLTSPDALARDASAYGMSLIAMENDVHGVSATEELTQALPKLDAPGKAAFSERLAQVSKSLTNGEADKKLNDDASKRLTMISAALIAESKSPDAAVRTAAVNALGEVPAPGACNALLLVAEKDPNADVKAAARKGIAFTALPESAGNLLQAVASGDKELKTVASAAFKKVREKAKSEELLPLVDSPDESVRREIVSALGKRAADSKATEGVTRALKDTSAEIRKLALKSMQLTNFAGPASQLLPLMSDADESVRVQCAETLGELRDDGSKKVLLEAFAASPEGETLKALSKALGQRSNGKDIPVIGVLVEQLNKHPESFSGIREALVHMTNAKQGAKRDAERMQWDAARWNAWWDNISKREKLKDEALDKLKKADARKQEDKKFYAELAKMTDEAFDALEKCLEMNKKDDPEDDVDIAAIQNKYKGNKYQFEKFQVLDEFRGKK